MKKLITLEGIVQHDMLNVITDQYIFRQQACQMINELDYDLLCKIFTFSQIDITGNPPYINPEYPVYKFITTLSI